VVRLTLTAEDESREAGNMHKVMPMCICNDPWEMHLMSGRCTGKSCPCNDYIEVGTCTIVLDSRWPTESPKIRFVRDNPAHPWRYEMGRALIYTLSACVQEDFLAGMMSADTYLARQYAPWRRQHATD
jgi:hypothetical protein